MEARAAQTTCKLEIFGTTEDRGVLTLTKNIGCQQNLYLLAIQSSLQIEMPRSKGKKLIVEEYVLSLIH